MGKHKEIKTLRDCLLDEVNANQHSLRGQGMLERSVDESGWGDSMTVDRNGKLISGEARLMEAMDRGDIEPIVVVSDGTRPVIHQRTDLDMDADPKDDPRARRLALNLNQVHRASYTPHAENLAKLAEMGVKFDDMFSTEEIDQVLNSVAAEVQQNVRDNERTMTETLSNSTMPDMDDTVSCTCPNCGNQFDMLKHAFGGGKGRSRRH